MSKALAYKPTRRYINRLVVGTKGIYRLFVLFHFQDYFMQRGYEQASLEVDNEVCAMTKRTRTLSGFIKRNVTKCWRLMWPAQLVVLFLLQIVRRCRNA